MQQTTRAFDEECDSLLVVWQLLLSSIPDFFCPAITSPLPYHPREVKQCFNSILNATMSAKVIKIAEYIFTLPRPTFFFNSVLHEIFCMFFKRALWPAPKRLKRSYEKLLYGEGNSLICMIYMQILLHILHRHKKKQAFLYITNQLSPFVCLSGLLQVVDCSWNLGLLKSYTADAGLYSASEK